MNTAIDDASVSSYLDTIVARARIALADNLVGAYAIGSLATGGYVPGSSDIDVLLLVDAPLTQATKESLVATLRHRALPCPTRGLELVIYRRDAVRIGTTAPAFELELNDGPAMPFRQTFDPADRPADDGTFWYALDRDIARQTALVLVGPPAAETFGALSEADIAAVIAEANRWHDEHVPDSDDAVRNARRGRVRVETGRWLPKRVSAPRRERPRTPHRHGRADRRPGAAP